MILVGRATRVQRFLMGLPKRYETVARLGFTSTTGDPEGEIKPGTMPGDELHLPTGIIKQTPPAYSAIKIRGKRAYALARAGEEVEIPEREVLVSRFELLSREYGRAKFVIECSSGTYVRSLIMDLHDAYCVELRRTRIGDFDVADASEERLLSLDDALSFMPVVELSPEHAEQASHGAAVPGRAKGIVPAARRGRPDRARRAPRRRDPEARRRLPRVKTHLAPRRAAEANAGSRWASSTACTSATAP